jgi:hypothetical protein
MPGVRAKAGKTDLTRRWQLDAGDYVVSMDLSADRRRCALGTGAGDLIVADLESGQIQWRVRAHPLGVIKVSWSPDGELLASCGQDPVARIWSAAGEKRFELSCGGGWVEQLAWSPSGQTLATSAGRKVRLWSSQADPRGETEAMPSTVSALAWSPGGEVVAATCYGGVHLWPPELGAKARHLEWQGAVSTLAWSPDGKIIACTSQDNSVHFWRLDGGEDSEMRGYPFRPKALAWDAESRLLATSGHATITVWEFSGKGPEGSTPLQLEAHDELCTCLAFCPSKTLLASAAQDGEVLLWEPGRRPNPLRRGALTGEATALQWRSAQQLVGADANGTVSCWSLG